MDLRHPQALFRSEMNSSAHLLLPNSSPLQMAENLISLLPKSPAVSQISGWYITAHLSPDLMPAGSSCGISIRFVPGAVGLRSGKIRIAIGGDPPTQPLIIPLQGNGVDSPVTLSQTYLVFRTVLVGMTSMPQFVRLTNRSAAPAKITSIAASPDFALAATTAQCVPGNTLAPLASCTVAIVWAPGDSGSRGGQVTIADSDPASPHIIDLQASATGIKLSSGTLRWNPTAVGVTGNSQTFEVRNEGRTAIKVESVEASGDFFQQNTCGKELIQHQSCSVTVWFQPTAAGERDGTLLIHDSDVTGMQQIFLTGVGSPLDLSPVKMDFGNQAAESTSAPQISYHYQPRRCQCEHRRHQCERRFCHSRQNMW